MQLPAEWVWTIFVALAALCGWLIPSPSKILEGHSAKFSQIEQRHNQLLEKQNVLERAQIESNTRLTAEVRGVAIAVRELKQTIKEWTPNRGSRHESRD
jgi:hypothetical protein